MTGADPQFLRCTHLRTSNVSSQSPQISCFASTTASLMRDSHQWILPTFEQHHKHQHHVSRSFTRIPPFITVTITGSNLTPAKSRYDIPYSNPPAVLSFNGMWKPPMNPSLVLLAMIENMQPVCRQFADAFPPSRTFDYGFVRITIQNLYLSCGPLTFNDACTALRGLAEYMVLHGQFYQWTFQIWVNGYAVGSGQIENLHQVLEAASVSGVATS